MSRIGSGADLRAGSSVIAGLSGIVLAGGASRRMGCDKALLCLEGRTLIARTIEVLYSLTTDVVVAGRVDLPSDARAVPAVPDEVRNTGPLAGLHAGLRAVEGRYVLCVGCDYPRLRADVLRLVAARAPGYDAAVPIIGGRSQPLHAAYRRGIVDIVGNQLREGCRSFRSLLDQIRVCWIEEEAVRPLDSSLESMQGVNTPEEWRAYVAALNS